MLQYPMPIAYTPPPPSCSAQLGSATGKVVLKLMSQQCTLPVLYHANLPWLTK